jgi:septal ring factor EnvC (AmiA/AmiB activator)
MSKQNLCSVCQKEAGICNCAGCKAFFCTKDFIDHRQWLSGEFEKVVEARNHLLQELSEKDQINHLQTALCSEIDQWEKVTLEKVRYAAKKTRDDVIQLLNDKINDIENEFNNVTKQLRAFEEMKNFVEDDLTNLNKNIDKLGKQLRQIIEHPSVTLNKEQNDQIEWTSVIYANDKYAHDKKVIVLKF